MALIYTPGLLLAQLNTVCPVVSLSMGDPKDTTTIAFTPDISATPAQIAAAQSILAALTPAILATVETGIITAAAALPDPLASAKTTAISELPKATTSGV